MQAGTDQTLSGTGITGVDFRTRGMFLYGGTLTQPVAAFSVSCTLMVCCFDASASTPSTGLTYAWTYGDGATDSGVTASHTYLTPGTKSVTLTVTDGLNQTAQVIHLANPTLGPPPTASFTCTCTLLQCSFDASASTGTQRRRSSSTPGTSVTARRTPPPGPCRSTPTASAGNYTVALTITDGVAQTSSVQHVVMPANASSVGFVGSAATSGKAATACRWSSRARSRPATAWSSSATDRVG